ncbi:MAG: hypothetical protein WKF37_06395 [Bryobacteraceae bacterium]
MPAIFGAWLLWERKWTQALYFLAPAIALLGWLLYLRAETGHLLGNREFAHYNVTFQLHPARLSLTLLRRVFYIFIDNFHFIGTIPLIVALRRSALFHTRAWSIVGLVALLQTLAVTLFGGAALERYLMPVLPLYYIAVAASLTAAIPSRRQWIGGAMVAGLAASIFLPSIFPYPYENNIAVVDFVQLQKIAAEFVESNYYDQSIASAWPFPDAIRRPELGMKRPLRKASILSTFQASPH